MKDLYHPVNAYVLVAKKIMRILQPYEKHLQVMVKQEDSLCLYTPDRPGKEGQLFAAVQILSSGVAFTVYDPGPGHNIFDCLPERLKRLYMGQNRFLLTKISAVQASEISELLLALFGIHSLGKYYHLYAHESGRSR